MRYGLEILAAFYHHARQPLAYVASGSETHALHESSSVHNALATFPWYKQLWDRYWPIFVMLLLLIGTWIPYFVNTDISDQNVMIFWGTDSPPGVHIPIEQLKNLKVVTDGSRLPPSIRRNYRIAAVADHDIGDIDTDDAELLKSSARDIVDGPISMLIPLTENFRNEYRQGDRGTNFYLLIVPKEVSPSQFDTLRQAKALGAKIINARGGPP